MGMIIMMIKGHLVDSLNHYQIVSGSTTYLNIC